MSVQYVKPYAKRCKNDAADAEAIADRSLTPSQAEPRLFGNPNRSSICELCRHAKGMR